MTDIPSPHDYATGDHSLTGDPAVDLAKLASVGYLQGVVEDPANWRREIRRGARRLKIKLRTYTFGRNGGVVAVTENYENTSDALRYAQVLGVDPLDMAALAVSESRIVERLDRGQEGNYPTDYPTGGSETED